MWLMIRNRSGMLSFAAAMAVVGIAWIALDRQVDSDGPVVVPELVSVGPDPPENAPAEVAPSPAPVTAENEIEVSRETERIRVMATPNRPKNPRFVAPEIGAIVGILRDASQGQVIRGANVEVERVESAGVLRRAVTAEDGSFRLSPLEAGKSYVVRARFSSLTCEDRVVSDLPSGDSRIELMLDRSSAWIVRFRDHETGLPVAGVLATFRGESKSRVASGVERLGTVDERTLADRREGFEETELDSVRSDSEGLCWIGGPRIQLRARLLLSARRPDYASIDLELAVGATPRGKEIEVWIEKLVTYFGTVVDPSGRPVAGALIAGSAERLPRIGYPSLESEAGMISGGGAPVTISFPVSAKSTETMERTDELGGFRLTGMKRGSLAAFILGFENGEQFSLPFFDPAGTGHRAPIEIRVPLARIELEGTVRVNGLPFAGRLVWSGPTRAGFADSDAHGNYRFRTMEPGVVVLEVIGSDRRVFARETIEVPQSGSTRYDFDIRMNSKARGVVRYSGGDCAVGVRVELRMLCAATDESTPRDSITAGRAGHSNHSNRTVFENSFSLAQGSQRVATVNTGPDGTFEFDVSDVTASYFVVAISDSAAHGWGTGRIMPGGKETEIVLLKWSEYSPDAR